MLRAMMLTLTLILITLTAAYLGRDEQLTQVLYRTKTPVQSSSAPLSESTPPPDSSVVSREQPPRFVTETPSAAEQPPLDMEGQSSQADSSQPQAQAAESQEEYRLPEPTEQQKLNAAEPYVKELFELKENSARELKKLVEEALTEYLLTQPDLRQTVLPELTEKYMPRAEELEKRSDTQAEEILLKMSTALFAIGADDQIAQDARAAYQNSKRELTEHYGDMLFPARQ